MANKSKMNPGAVKASKEQKDAIKAFCESQGIEYWEDVHVGSTGTIIPLYLPKFRIAVRVGDDQQWYDTVKRCTHPVFIRDTDSVEFVIEKVTSTIEKHLMFMSGRKQPKTSFQKKRAKRFKDFLSSLKAEKKLAYKRTK